MIKKCLLLFLVIVCSVSVFSQNEWVQFGLNLSNVAISSDSSSLSPSIKPHFNIGAKLYLPINEKLDFETNLFYSLRGFKTAAQVPAVGSNISDVSDIRTNLGYIDLPHSVRFHTVPVDEKLFFASVGIYSSILVFAFDKQTYKVGGVKKQFKESLPVGSSALDFTRRFDYGLTIGGGVELGFIQLGLNYDLGLHNIASDQSGNTSVYNRNFRISIAFRN